MKKFISNIYHKFFKYKFEDNFQNINYEQICEIEKSESEKYRLQLFNSLDLKKIKSVLDYGCGYGMNMKVIKNINNEIILNGMDISKTKIRMLKILNDNIYKMSLNVHEIKNLPNFEKKFDLVFTDAVLIYVNPNNIYKLLKNLINSSKKKILLHELCNLYDRGKVDYLHIHDYKNLIKRINPKLKIKTFKSSKPGTPWNTHGTIILIDKENAN
tara:strand:+ start:47 stop:688 length:642 start_codon:yes stop_codon:yes gene_type:complete